MLIATCLRLLLCRHAAVAAITLFIDDAYYAILIDRRCAADYARRCHAAIAADTATRYFAEATLYVITRMATICCLCFSLCCFRY